MRAHHATVVLVALLSPQASVQQPGQTQGARPCREHPQLSGSCFTVHGALRFYNGSPSFRIWRIGSDRILGISEGRFYLKEYCNLPKWLEDRVGTGSQVIADFVVCPFMPDEPGVMRLVCVDTASNVHVRQWR